MIEPKLCNMKQVYTILSSIPSIVIGILVCSILNRFLTIPIVLYSYPSTADRVVTSPLGVAVAALGNATKSPY